MVVVDLLVQVVGSTGGRQVAYVAAICYEWVLTLSFALDRKRGFGKNGYSWFFVFHDDYLLSSVFASKNVKFTICDSGS
jgi:hypothetical protein